jgi:methionine aminopeptidase
VARISGNLDMSSSGQIVNLVTPTNNQDAATKSYVDTKTTEMATTSSVSTAITNALGSGSMVNLPTIYDTGNQNASFRLVMSQQTTGRATLYNDEGLTYNSNTNTLTAAVFSGNATSANSAATAGYIDRGTQLTGFYYNSAWTMVADPNTRMVGIGTASPAFPLHVANTALHYTGNIRGLYILDGAFYTRGGAGNWDVSIFCAGVLRLGGYAISDSDRRIKKNIKDIDCNEAISQLRQIRPKIYNYIDNTKKGNSIVYGFIAQDVKDVILHSTICTKDYIPNFYSMGKISILDANNHIYEISSEKVLSFEKVIDDSGNEVIFHKVKFYGYDNTEYICSLIQVNNIKNIVVKLEKEYKFSNKQEEYNKIFIYGQEINDFHSLEKEAIFTVATAALQEVDRQQQADKARIAELEATVATQQSLINDILERLKALERT